MEQDNRSMADILKKLDATNPLMHYEEYRASLLPRQEIDYKDVADASKKIINPKITAEEHLAVNAVLKKALLQPVMADTYAQNGIKPQEVAEYVDTVMEYYPSEMKKLLSGLVTAYEKGANAMNDDDSINHRREWFALNSGLNNSKEITASMKKFVEAKNPVKEEPKKEQSFWGKKIWRWVEEKVPGAKTIAAGFVIAVAAPNLPQMIKVWDKQADKTEVMAKNDKQTKAQDGKTYTPSVKDFSNQGRA